jgi:hypothetical protein
MKYYHIYFLILKIIITIHIALIVFKILPADSPLTLIDESFFKISIGSFLGFYFLFATSTGLEFGDRIIISIAGFVILADVDWLGLYKLMYTSAQSMRQEMASS